MTRAFTVGAVSGGMLLNCFVPVIAGASPSLTLVAIEKESVNPAAGTKDTPASSAFTEAMAPLALQTPPLKLELTPLTFAVDKLPAAGLERVRVALIFGLSTSLTTMSIRCCGVSRLYCSAAERLVPVGGSLTGVTSNLIVLGVGSRLMPPLAVPPLSRTWKEKEATALPLALAAGV